MRSSSPDRPPGRPTGHAPVFRATYGGGFTVLRVAAPLTHANAATAGRELAALLAGQAAGWVLLDLTGVGLLGSAGLTACLDLARRVGAAGGRLTVVGVSPLVGRVFALAGLDRRFDLRPTGRRRPATRSARSGRRGGHGAVPSAS